MPASDQDGERQIQRGHQPGQIPQHAEAAVPDGIGDRRPNADRRVVHDDVRELEHRFGHRFTPGDDGTSLLAEGSADLGLGAGAVIVGGAVAAPAHLRLLRLRHAC